MFPPESKLFGADSRPRYDYALPDGRVVKIIHDHGETPALMVSYQLASGAVVMATLCQCLSCKELGDFETGGGLCLRCRQSQDDARLAQHAAPSLSLGLSLSSRPSFTAEAETWDEVRKAVRAWLAEQGDRDTAIVAAICAQVHAWRAGIGSAHDAMTAISKLLHEQVPGGEGRT